MAGAVLIFASVGAGPLTSNDLTHANMQVEKHRGIDSCGRYTASQMAAYYSASPYGTFGFYLGGQLGVYNCGTAPTGTSWTGAVAGQGWDLEPIWSDEQPTCTTLSNTYSTGVPIGARTGSANQDGVNSGASAVSEAYSRGIAGPIFLDIDVPPASQCQQATYDYVQGWVNVLHYYGYTAGLYGYPVYLNSAASGAVPDEVVAVYISSNGSVYSGLASSGLNTSYWTADQRGHQYTTQHYEAYGGQNFFVDNDCFDEKVWGNTIHSTYSACLS